MQKQNYFKKFKSVFFASLGGLFLLWVLYHRRLNIYISTVIAEMDLCQGTFCLMLCVIFFIKLLLWSKELFQKHLSITIDEKFSFIPIFFDLSINIFMNKCFLMLQKKVQNSLFAFYNFFIPFIPNYSDILLF